MRQVRLMPSRQLQVIYQQPAPMINVATDTAAIDSNMYETPKVMASVIGIANAMMERQDATPKTRSKKQ